MCEIVAWGMPGGSEWILIALIGLVLFGKRLPEVGRSLGKGIVEFKKGLKGVEDEVSQVDERVDTAHDAGRAHSAYPALPAGHDPGTTQYKFDPFTGQPVQPAVPAGARFDPFTGQPLEPAASDYHSSATVAPEPSGADHDPHHDLHETPQGQSSHYESPVSRESPASHEVHEPQPAQHQ